MMDANPFWKAFKSDDSFDDPMLPCIMWAPCLQRIHATVCSCASLQHCSLFFCISISILRQKASNVSVRNAGQIPEFPELFGFVCNHPSRLVPSMVCELSCHEDPQVLSA